MKVELCRRYAISLALYNNKVGGRIFPNKDFMSAAIITSPLSPYLDGHIINAQRWGHRHERMVGKSCWLGNLFDNVINIYKKQIRFLASHIRGWETAHHKFQVTSFDSRLTNKLMPLYSQFPARDNGRRRGLINFFWSARVHRIPWISLCDVFWDGFSYYLCFQCQGKGRIWSHCREKEEPAWRLSVNGIRMHTNQPCLALPHVYKSTVSLSSPPAQ